jgi:hypothetical protein
VPDYDGDIMKGTIDAHGMRFSWLLDEIGESTQSTLHVTFGVLSTSRNYDWRLTPDQAEDEARALIPLVIDPERQRAGQPS